MLNKDIYYKFWSGDIIQYSYDDVSKHSQIVIAQQAYDGKASLWMDQHSGDRKDISLLWYLQKQLMKKIKYLYLIFGNKMILIEDKF